MVNAKRSMSLELLWRELDEIGPMALPPRHILELNTHGGQKNARVDENGRYTGENATYALCGFIRAMGESDDAMNRLAQRDGYLKAVWSASR